MSTGLTQQLADYGDVFVAEVDALARETIMTTDQSVISIDRDENDRKKSPWRRVGALVGAAAVIIASIVGLTMLRSDSDAIAAPPYATAEDAARATVRAINVGSWGAYRAAFADDGTDALVSSGKAISENEAVAEARFALFVAAGLYSDVESCTTLMSDSTTCRTADSDVIIDALGVGPLVWESVFGIEDGLLVYVGSPTETEIEVPEILTAFDEWLAETNHPAAISWGAYVREPVGKDPSIVVAAMLNAVDEFLAQYEG
jgi:hypothetical protein